MLFDMVGSEFADLGALVLGILFLATVIESMIEHLVAIPLKNAGIGTALVLPYVSLVVSVLLVWAFDLRLGELVGLKTDFLPAAYFLTALPVSRGANAVSDLIGRYLKR